MKSIILLILLITPFLTQYANSSPLTPLAKVFMKESLDDLVKAAAKTSKVAPSTARVAAQQIDTSSDFDEALALAERGDQDAQHSLGYMYTKGIGVSENGIEAAYWFQKAAYQGHADAQYALGHMHAAANGIPENHAEAYAWWSIAKVEGQTEDQARATYALDILKSRMTKQQIAQGQALAGLRLRVIQQ